MPTYEHKCTSCNHEWEEIYSIKAEPPKICPQCNCETAKRLVSGGSGRGTVELTGHELKEKIFADAADMKIKAATNENFLANLVGENKYQQNVVQREKSAVRPKIRYKK